MPNRLDVNNENPSMAVGQTSGVAEVLLVDEATNRLLVTIKPTSNTPTRDNTIEIDVNDENTAFAVDSDTGTTEYPLLTDDENYLWVNFNIE